MYQVIYMNVVIFEWQLYGTGGIKKGDQILKVSGHTMEGVTLTQAQEILWKVEQETKPGVGEL